MSSNITKKSDQKTFYLEPLGCAKNQVDAEIMIARLEAQGWIQLDSPQDAGVILVNSCGFIQPAKEESIETTLDLIDQHPEAQVVLAGCLAQRYARDLAKDIPELAGVFGNHAVEQIADYLETRLPKGERIFTPEADYGGTTTKSTPNRTRTRLLSYPGSAYVKISEGCRNRCAFCAIPLIRGSLRSRTIQDVSQEVRGLITRGIREINLIAQDLSDFGRDRQQGSLQNKGRQLGEFIQLINELLSIPRDFWIRPLYIYPEHFPLEILEICQRDGRLLPYFDIPMQHASQDILKAMGRPGTKESNLTLIQNIRAKLPQAVIRTSLITGFPGETDQDIEELMDFQSAAKIDWLGVFAYSQEEGTRAAEFPHQIDPKQALLRKERIEQHQLPIMHAQLDRFIGTNSQLLIEEIVPPTEDQQTMALGRTPFQAPEVDGLTVLVNPPEGICAGQIIPVKILRRSGVDLTAQAL